MTLTLFFNQYPILFYSVMGIFGLCIGSFLNVVIYRLPAMLQREWRQQCHEFLKLSDPLASSTEPFNLIGPASHCRHCQQPLKIWHNIPLLSFLLLRGRCAYCQTSISGRYFTVELLTAVVTLIVSYHFGFSWMLLAALILSYYLISLSFIDYDYQLLPDSLTLSLLWLGLLTSLTGLFAPPSAAIIGAAAGYGSLWLFNYLFTKITHRQGMGHGDFKLLAALGAYLGWQLLPLIIILACVLGILLGGLLIALKKQSRDKPIAFGPFLALAGWVALLWGPAINDLYWQWVGF